MVFVIELTIWFLSNINSFRVVQESNSWSVLAELRKKWWAGSWNPFPVPLSIFNIETWSISRFSIRETLRRFCSCFHFPFRFSISKRQWFRFDSRQYQNKIHACIARFDNATSFDIRSFIDVLQLSVASSLINDTDAQICSNDVFVKSPFYSAIGEQKRNFEIIYQNFGFLYVWCWINDAWLCTVVPRVINPLMSEHQPIIFRAFVEKAQKIIVSKMGSLSINESQGARRVRRISVFIARVDIVLCCVVLRCVVLCYIVCCCINAELCCG